MSLQQEIKSGIMEAMKAHEQVRLDVLRGMSSAFMNELVAKGKKPQDELSDEEALVVITKLAKQRKDSIEQFTKGGREDLVGEEKAQLEVLEKYLPKLMEKSEVEVVVKNLKEKSGITDPKEKGKFMAEVMRELKGKADGMLVKTVVDEVFG